MKVILTGSTGFIGAEVLSRCLSSPSITSVVAISRRPLSNNTTTNSKLTTVIHNDFASWPSTFLQQPEFQGAQACLWSLGIAMPKTPEQNREVNHDYPLAAARAMKEVFTTTTTTSASKFRFVYLSGHFIERDQSKSLWFLGEGRKLRGMTELEVMNLKGNGFETFVIRPGLVTKKDTAVALLRAVAGLLSPFIRVDWLAAAMIAVGVGEGKKDVQQSWSSDEMAAWGRN